MVRTARAALSRSFRAARRPRHSPSRRRGARRLSSRLHHRRPNGPIPRDLYFAVSSGPMSSFVRPVFVSSPAWQFRQQSIRRWSALDIGFARFCRLRNGSVVRSSRSARPRRSHLFKRRRSSGGLLPRGLDFRGFAVSVSKAGPRKAGLFALELPVVA